MTTTYDLARLVNLRLNDGDESKFSVMLIVIGEIQYITKPINYFGVVNKIILAGKFDEVIISKTECYNKLVEDFGELRAKILFQFQSKFAGYLIEEKKKKC